MPSLRNRLVTVAAFAFVSLTAGEAPSQTLDAKGVKIHYAVEGKGEPVVLEILLQHR